MILIPLSVKKSVPRISPMYVKIILSGLNLSLYTNFLAALTGNWAAN
jgi:hypothetical protein